MEEEIVTIEEDVAYLPVTAIDLLLDNKNFQITMKLKDKADKVLSEKTIDLPIEEMITDGKYDNDTKSIVLTKKSGDTFSIDISNIIDGLATQSSVNDKTSEMEKNIDETNKTQNEDIQNNTKDIQIIFKYLGDNQFLNKETTYTAAINTNTNKIETLTNTLNNYSLVTETGSKIDLSIDNSTFVMTLKLKDKNDKVLSTQTIDFPLETMVVNGKYDNKTKEVILTLQSGSTIKFSIADLIDGLVSQKDYDKQVETFNDSIKTINSNIQTLQNDTSNLETSKQDKLTAGDNITILNNRISSKDTTYKAGKNIKIEDTTISTENVYDESEVNKLLEDKQTKIDRLNSIVNILPSQNSKGSNITIEDTPEAPLKDIKIYGDCYQDTSNKIYKCDGTETGVYDFTYGSKIYEFTMPTITSDSVLVFNTNDLTLKLGEDTIETQVVDTASGTSIELDDTPNPYYPIEIKTVSGENEVKICEKNLFDINVWIKNKNIVESNSANMQDDGTIIIDNPDNKDVFTNTGIIESGKIKPILKIFAIKVKPNTNYTISYNITNIQTTLDRNVSHSSFYNLIDKDYNFIRINPLKLFSNENGRKTITITTTEDTEYLTIRFGCNKLDTHIEYSNIQIEQSDTATDYEPYKGSINTLSLGDLELCGIGDYKDYIYFKDNKWWKHKEVEKVVINSYISKNGNSTDTLGLYFKYRHNYGISDDNGNISTYYINNMEKLTDRLKGMLDKNKLGSWKDSTSFYDALPGITTLEEANNWIQEHPETIYYILRTPTEEEITDTTLISQLNNLRNATTYEGKTNIIVTSENLPAVLDVDTFKKNDLDTVKSE